jgi:cell wall-associated NlpC family hydrolase
MNQVGIVIAPTFMRGLPNIKPLYETSDDFPFDQLQYTEVKPNEPVRILHESDTGAWVFVETAYGLGWVKADTVKIADESLQQRLTTAELVVVTRDFAVIRDKQGKALPQPKIGTLYPIVKEEPDYWLINVAVAGEGDLATLKTARIAKKDARRFPLPFSAETVTHVGNELLKTPYGWGELFRDRDCSATTRDFFIPFGIWLPRNSRQQVNSGQPVSLENLSKADKEKLLREQGVPFRTLVHRKGHIMLYVGLMYGKPVILHNTWAIRFKTKSGQEEKFYVGRTVLTTTEAGIELPLSRGTILDHIDGIVTLPAKNQSKPF